MPIPTPIKFPKKTENSTKGEFMGKNWGFREGKKGGDKVVDPEEKTRSVFLKMLCSQGRYLDKYG